jgi:hypothetical protein
MIAMRTNTYWIVVKIEAFIFVLKCFPGAGVEDLYRSVSLEPECWE